MVDQLEVTATDSPQYDSAGLKYVEWRKTSNRNRRAIHDYTIFNCMLKGIANEQGLLTGQRVLDLGCGDGYYTRRLKALNCASILGVDVSATMINIARDIELQEPKGIDYMVADVKNLLPFEQPFDLVTGFFLLHHFRTKEELLQIARISFAQLGERKYFLGVTVNVVAGKDAINGEKYRRYGFTMNTKIPLDNEFIPDGTEVTLTLYNDQDEIAGNFTTYYLSPKIYEEVFKEAGFTTFRWVHFQWDPDMPNKAFYDDFMNCPSSIGLIATK